MPDQGTADPTERELLASISSPADLKRLSTADLNRLAAEIREELIEIVIRNGGHLGASLGTVELTLALHYVFDTPRDKLVWDVGHQAYIHKLLTGRRDRFPPSARKAASPAFSPATRASTTPSAPDTPAPASRPRSAWRSRSR